MSLKIYTYSDPYELDRETYWDEIRNCAHFCVSRNMVNGLGDMYPSLKNRGCLTAVRVLINSLYPDWENKNMRVKQMLEVDTAINSMNVFNFTDSPAYNSKSLVNCIRLFKELGLSADSFDVSKLKTDQVRLVEIYKNICGRENSSFEFERITDAEKIGEKIMEALQKSHKNHEYKGLDKDTVVFHGIHQFSPAILCAIEDISRAKNVILLFNYQEQYKAVYRTWLNIYSLFNEETVFGTNGEFKPSALMADSFAGNTLADSMGKLSDGRICFDHKILDKLEVIEFENNMEFAGYCARLFEDAQKEKKRHAPKVPVLYYMAEQLYSASDKVNDILREYFPEQFGERHFLDYPIGRFFVSVTEMWDNENERVRVGDMSYIRDCLAAGIIAENAPGELLNSFNIIEPYIENETDFNRILSSLRTLRESIDHADAKLRKIGYLNIGGDKLDRLINALDELNTIIRNFFWDFNKGGDNFNRFYKRLHNFIESRVLNMEPLDKDMKEKILPRLLERMNDLDLPDTGTFICLKDTLSFYLSQDENLLNSAKWIVRNFEQIDGDILRSEKQRSDKTCYHFCCLSDKDICVADDENLPWPLDIKFFEYSYAPLEKNYRIFLKSKTEYRNFKRFALIYGLEFNRIGCKLSYVKSADRKENELYHLIGMLGVKVTKYHNENSGGYVPYLSYSVPSDVPYRAREDELDKIKYGICPYRFALECIVRDETRYSDKYLVKKYMEALLKNEIAEEYSGRNISGDELKTIIADKCGALDNIIHILNEYDKMEMTSGVYESFIKKNAVKINEMTDLQLLLNENLIEVKKGFEPPNIDIKAIVNNEENDTENNEENNTFRRYTKNSGNVCGKCSVRDICLKTSVR